MSASYPLVFGVSGASGMPLAREVLRHFAATGLNLHLIVSQGAQNVLRHEGNVGNLSRYASVCHAPDDLAAPPASGSWPSMGMVICPCSMSTLASVATGVGSNLVHRAADVALKERRPLVLVVRETPLSLVHLKNMQAATEAGAVIMPFCPAFYTGTTNLADTARFFSGRILDVLRVPHQLCDRRWGEPSGKTEEFRQEC